MNIFIVGVGRSGTSLLQSMISNHSMICMPPETGFLRKSVLSINSFHSMKWNEFLIRNPKLERLTKNISIDRSLKFKNALEFYQQFIDSYCQNKPLHGDKDPRLIEFIWSLNKLFPEAKFIHIIRDPRDVLLSKKKANWSKNRSDWRHIFACYVQVKLGELIGRKLFENQYHLLTYERLIACPEKELIELCDFLEIKFENRMLHFQKKAKELVSDDEKQWKKETLGPLIKNNTGKWVGKIPTREVALIEMLCMKVFNLGGYSKSESFQELGITQKIQVNLLYLIFKISGAVYQYYRLWQQKWIVYKKYDNKYRNEVYWKD